MTTDLKLTPSIALAAYAETLTEGRRVLVIGNANSSLAEQLLQRGARLVHVCDPDASRVGEAVARNLSRNISFAPLAEGGLALRQGAFDLAVLENLAGVGDVEAALRNARQALSTRGAALIACPNPAVDLRLLPAENHSQVAIDYYSLYDAVARHFDHVRMLGQTPFVGYAIVDFAPDTEPLPALDTGLVPGGAEEPEWYIALASPRPVLLDEFAIVQFPFSATLQRSAERGQDELLRAARAAERKVRQRLNALEAENKRLSRTEARTVRTDPVEIERLRRELRRRDEWIAQLEARAEAADARADEFQEQAEGTLEKLAELKDEFEQYKAKKKIARQQAKAERKTAERRTAEREQTEAVFAQGLEQQKTLEAEVERLKGELGQREAEAQRLHSALEEANRRAEALSGFDDASQTSELKALENQLAERGREIRSLQGDLQRTEQTGRELLRELEDLRSGMQHAELGVARANGDDVATLEEDLEQLAQLNALREADLIAARWTIEELELKLRAKAYD